MFYHIKPLSKWFHSYHSYSLHIHLKVTLFLIGQTIRFTKPIRSVFNIYMYKNVQCSWEWLVKKDHVFLATRGDRAGRKPGMDTYPHLRQRSQIAPTIPSTWSIDMIHSVHFSYCLLFARFSSITVIQIKGIHPSRESYHSLFCLFCYPPQHFLSLYQTIPTFNGLKKENFWKHCGKRRKCW